MSIFFLILLLCFKVLYLVSFLGEANIESDDNNNSNSVYIVYMGALLKSAPRNDHARLMSELLKRKKCVVRTYNQSFVGFAARLSEEEARSIEERAGVVSVFPDRVSQLHTTRSWDFLMSQNAAFRKEHSSSTIAPSQLSCSAGADTIIGVFDTGIWPEHPSFSDVHMTQIPSRWKGICMPGENLTDPFVCNKKVIGARYYDDPEEAGFIVSARDDLGHGTHTASTAAGVPVKGASYYNNGLAYGTARGGSPGSRIAAYCICSSGGCLSSGILKAFDDAIADGVDVISISLGASGSEYFLNEAIAIGSFHAVEKGVVVVGSGGNRGPSPGTVVNVAPWILSVAATTLDRAFETGVVLLGGDKVIKGGGIGFSGLEKEPVYHLVDGSTASSDQHDVFNASNCIPGSLDVGKVKGKIIVCKNTVEDYDMREKFDTLKRQLGVIGMIVIDNRLGHVSLKLGSSPVAVVNENDGVEIQNYIKSTGNPVATILPTAQISQYKPAPVVSIFSARGPTPGNQNLIKPDIAAPGENILAAWRPNDTSVGVQGKEPPLFNIDSGTSVSCPHVSALAAILKSRHPSWSPSAIKSAIMTTAISSDNSHSLITTYNGSTATPYELGSGEINLLGSMWPGLVYEIETDDYFVFLCNYGYNTSAVKTIASTLPDNFACPSDSRPDLISEMNYPSMAVSGLKANEVRTVRRTVTNVGDEYSTYYATVETPAGMQLQVVPNILRFTRTVKKLSFQVNFIITKQFNEPRFGSFTWSSGKYRVRSPVVVSNA